MKSKKGAPKLLLALALALALLSAVPTHTAVAESKRLMFTNDSGSSTCTDRMVNEIFKAMGIGVSIDTMSARNALDAANQGRYDGICPQPIAIESAYPNLVRVPATVGLTKVLALAREDDDAAIGDWGALSGLRVGCLEQKLSPIRDSPDGVASLTVYGTMVRLYAALTSREIDVALITHNSCDAPLLPVGVRVSGEIEREDTFIYLNQRNRSLIPQIVQVIDSMKRDGSMEKILRGEKLDQLDVKSVLFLTSNTSEMVWDQHIYEGVREVLDADNHIVFHNVSLNAQRLANEVSRDQSALATIRAERASTPPDAVIAAGEEALSFVVNNYNVLFCGIPVVYCAVMEGEPEKLVRREDAGTIGGATYALPAAALMDEILRLRPETKTAFIINDHSHCGRLWEAEIKRQLAPYEDRLELIYNREQPFKDLVELAAALGEDAVILSGWYFTDSLDLYLPQIESQHQLAQAASAPVFGLIEGGVGRGQLGGLYIDGARQGRLAAQRVRALLNGNPQPEEPPGRDAYFLFDNDMLSEYGLEPAILPPGATLINRTPTLRESDPRLFTILVSVGSCMLLIIFVLALFTHMLHQKNAHLRQAQAESRRAFQAAEESNREIERVRNRIQMIVRTAPVAYCLLVDDKVIETNEYYHESFGAPAEGEGSANFKEVIQKLSSSDQATGVLAHLRTRDGSTKRFACSAANTIWHGKPAVVIWSVNIEDMERIKEEIATAKQEALQRVLEKEIEANRLKSHFLMNISHELKTPMNAIIGMTELAKNVGDTGKLHESINQIGSAASVLLGIIEQVLNLSMIEEGRVCLRPQETDVAQLIENVIATMQPTADPRRITIRLDTTGLAHKGAMMDGAHVCQVLMALLSNAIKFSPEGASILVRVQEEPVSPGLSRYRFSVKDRGIGIPKEKQDRLFNAFEQVDDSITREHGGIGLGLTIAQKLVHLMDGEITFESELGRGSEFSFWFQSQPLGAGTGAEQKTEVDLSRLRALVVDDVDINRVVLMGQLEAMGIQVDEAENGEQAVERVRSAPPDWYDLILMDLQMPVMDGYTATRAIRALPRADTDRLLILAVSANSMPEDIRKSIDAGMNAHLAKPFYPDQLKEKIESLLTQSPSTPPQSTPTRSSTRTAR